MTTVLVRRPRPVLVARPDGSTPGALGLDMAVALAGARQAAASVCLLTPQWLCNPALFALVPTDVPRLQPRSLRGLWLGARWRARRVAESLRAAAVERRASFWLEIYRELRRHVGDRRLPYPWRARLRQSARGAFARAMDADRRPGSRVDRRLLETAVPSSLPPALATDAAARAASLGISPPRRVVALDVRRGLDRLGGVADALAADGYTVVRLGDAGDGRLERPGVVDLTDRAERSPALEVFVLQTAAFLVCDTLDAQQVAYLTNTPCLTIDAVDPIASYPARRDGVYTLAAAIDLETGVELALEDRLGGEYAMNRGRYRHRINTPAEILAAVREMQDGIGRGWDDGPAQMRFRELVGRACAGRRAAQRGQNEVGFIGSGRLARVQAERLG
jgi:putative glycosyltransferase (TIGR04372 family)